IRATGTDGSGGQLRVVRTLRVWNPAHAVCRLYWRPNLGHDCRLAVRRRDAQDDVELRGELADPRLLERREIDAHSGLGLLVADAAVDAVLFVAGVALDVALRAEQFLAALLNLEVDVRRGPARIEDRLDRAEIVLAVGRGHETAETLEVLVLLILLLSTVGGGQVDAVAVALPDFDVRVLVRAAGGVEDAAGQVRDLADGRRDAVVDDDQVVVGVERELVRVERAFGLRRRAGEHVGEGAADGEEGGRKRGAAEEAAAVVEML